jgi:hypothetical protein
MTMLFNIYLLRGSPKLRKRVFGTLRVIGYGLAVSAGLGALTVRSAIANVEQESLNLGRQLDDLSDLLQSGYELRLNGERAFVATSTTDETVSEVLNRFEGHCNKSRAFDPDAWKSLTDLKGTETLKPEGMNPFGVVRKEDTKAGDGTVLCFTSDHGVKSFFTALQDFTNSGDLHDLGDVRYVHASRHVDKATRTTKAHTYTMVQTMWTQGSFNVKKIIGEPGKEAPGADFASVPRPLASTRRFTMEAIGTPYSARIYESSATPTQVLDDYTQKMLDADWVMVKNPTTQMPPGKDGHWFTKVQTGEQVIVAVEENEGKTVAAVASMGLVEKPPVKSE